jgi:hypothetical protein
VIAFQLPWTAVPSRVLFYKHYKPGREQMICDAAITSPRLDIVTEKKNCWSPTKRFVRIWILHDTKKNHSAS